jgi:hypothetical protein
MDKTVLATIGNVVVWHFAGASTFFFRSGLEIDADGSPNAYGPNGKGLDNLANAGRKGNWWALVTDSGKPTGNPVIQGPGDPAPGFYVSTTALADPSLRDERNPKKYVDAAVVPYIVLPGHHQGSHLSSKLRLGDVALVTDGKTGRFAYVIYADIGPQNQLGEGSIALAQALGVGSDPKRGNGARDIVYVVFPGSGNGRPKTPYEIQATGRLCFQAWGGFKRLAQCFPEYTSTFPKQSG